MATIDSNIALGIRPVQIENPLAQYSQVAQFQNARNQNALAQYQLGAAKREEESVNALNEAYVKAYDPATGKLNRNLLRESLARGGFGSKIPAIEKTLIELDKEDLLRQKAQGEVNLQPTELSKKKVELVDLKLKQSRQFLDTINPADPNAPQAYVNWVKASHADPIIGPELVARGTTLDQSLARVQQAINQGPQAFADFLNQSKLGVEKFMELNKPTTSVVDQGGQKQVIQTPGLGGPPKSIGTYSDVPLPEDVATQKKTIARAGAPSITVSTEKKYGEKLAGNVADDDIELVKTARKAPQLAESANRIIDLVKQGNVFTGPVADVKLNIARGLNVVGANNAEKIANTEALIAATGQSTLDAIKSAGLGTGQGFTDKDLKFLQGIAGGTITYTPQTLTELAKLQHKAATRSAETWNSRFKDIPASATEGLGLRAAPEVPPLSSGAKPTAAPAVNSIQNGYRFKGGNPAVQANWEKQ
jgi:hypothetical protein